MKNFIFTFNYAINYGAFLQCYSLNQICKNSIVADLTPSPIKNINSYVGPYGRRKLPIIWFFIAIVRSLKTNFVIRKFRFKENLFLQLSSRFRNWDGSKSRLLLDGNNGIVGSDQVWNPKFIEGRERIFFLDSAKFAKKIAFSVSLGMKKWPIEFEKKVLPYLRKFDAISVREKSAKEYLESIGFHDVEWVCDPTILHDGEFYRRKFIKEKFDSCIFVYTIREKVSQSLLNFSKSKVVNINAGKQKNLVSVSAWLSYVYSADYVVTDSFHCTVFCLLFHKKFIVLKNQSRGSGMNERFSSLLGLVNLEYRCIPSCNEVDVENILNRFVDWAKVDAVLKEWRVSSLNWLKNALES